METKKGLYGYRFVIGTDQALGPGCCIKTVAPKSPNPGFGELGTLPCAAAKEVVEHTPKP